MVVTATDVILTVRATVPDRVTRELVRSRGIIHVSGWQHIAVQIDGLIWRIFTDGVQSGVGESRGMPTRYVLSFLQIA